MGGFHSQILFGVIEKADGPRRKQQNPYQTPLTQQRNPWMPSMSVYHVTEAKQRVSIQQINIPAYNRYTNVPQAPTFVAQRNNSILKSIYNLWIMGDYVLELFMLALP